MMTSANESGSVEPPVTTRFRWTAYELSQAYRYHFRHRCRPVFRFGLHFLFAVIFLGGILMLMTSGPAGKAPLPLSIGFLIVGIYWFAIWPFERRWMIRRQFSKRPDQDMEVEWQVADDKIVTQSALGHSEIGWQAFTKMLRTPTGVMVYTTDQIFNWLPRRGFASGADFERCVALAKSKIQRTYDVA
jgi:hypothetical protein